MQTVKPAFNILVVEDNAGDFLLVEEFLHEKFDAPIITNVASFRHAKELLLLDNIQFDTVLLDLSLPDKKGEQLILEMLEICAERPIVVLTGYADFDFGVKSLSLGVSDYILKDELTALSLYKSIIYSTERKKAITELEESEKKYSQLFHLSPLPMWVVNVDSLQFLDVNLATVKHYGYTREEFLAMTLKDIRRRQDDHELEYNIAEGKRNPGLTSTLEVIHKKKNGDEINVEVEIAHLQFKGINANIVIATDITERLKYINAIEEQNEKLKEIAWMQSHVVRAPLARIIGLVNVIKEMEGDIVEKEKMLDYVIISANELDEVIKSITLKTDGVKC